MTTTTSSIAKFLYPGLGLIFNKSYADYKAEYSKVFTTVQSDKFYEERAGFVGLGLARRKASGSNVYMDAFSQGFIRRTTNDVYALGYKVTMEAVQDNKYPELTLKNTKFLSRALNLTREYNGALLIDRAFNSSYAYADGVELCSTAHLTKTGLTYANELATPADLSETALQQVLINIGDMTDERGNLIALRGMKLVVPNELQFEADRILGSTLRPGTAENDKNVLLGKLEIVVNHFLDNSGAWYVMTDLPAEEGLIMQQRMAPQFDNDTEFSSKDLVFSAFERYKFDAIDPRCIYGSAGA